MDNEKQSIRFKYIFADDYNPVFANGAYGGISPKGEFVIHFYQERQPIPKAIEQELKADGSLGAIEKHEPGKYNETVIRYITTGVTLNYAEAKEIHAWLGKMLTTLEEQADQSNEKGSE